MNNQAGRHADLSEGEDEELMFAFEDHDDNFSPRLHSGGSQIFHSIDGMEFERPANPLAAVLEHCAAKEAKKRGRDEDEGDEPEAQESADLFEEKLMPLPSNRKRKMFERPTVATTEVVRPTAKRYKSERSTTAPACLMGNLSLHRTSEPQQEIPDLANEVGNGPLRSASINIPHKFQPIHWPGDSAVVARSSGRERSHSLDVASPLRVHFNDMVLGTTASRAGSYTGS
ncbi:hypothetical protein BBO99_00006573 [Phytophthora kernoviae]|uniref:Uncharacterized protein n=2 Tax=Phytophthora kernoviae TaxID=325452 RepID=A0A3R7KS91_9STRA|nr:hypothetical protein G195_007794 [Phytophthora kernoviae 00238/432]KAG2521572.1 hypothetical protein JM16_006176 [Phytophthora kernoviae]KAG2522732.1 hypothetical protein JM18_005991 [Phytophthora kernoviae]RLN14970.1 hypothetical protein BBI17_006594 [Phytophthora kernoviae]RLN77678.1 hypothetical protein BBO99_00006573 [Phytophthora kernoviae]